MHSIAQQKRRNTVDFVPRNRYMSETIEDRHMQWKTNWKWHTGFSVICLFRWPCMILNDCKAPIAVLLCEMKWRQMSHCVGVKKIQSLFVFIESKFLRFNDVKLFIHVYSVEIPHRSVWILYWQNNTNTNPKVTLTIPRYPVTVSSSLTRSSAIAERPRDAWCCWVFWLVAEGCSK